jgi:DNA-binding GntR family transcriptional regulator
MSNDKLSSLTKPPSIEELVISNLRKAIVTAQFKPGDPLDQEELARQLGVSRTPVRQALRALASENLVTFYPRRGAVVAELSVEEIEDIYLIRMLLEGPAARMGAEQSSPQATRALEALYKEMCATPDDTSKWLMLDREFHTSIYDAAHYPRLTQMIKSLRDDVERYVRVYIDVNDNIPRSNAKHALILDAFSAGDGPACEQHTLDHLEEVFQIFRSNLEQDKALG